MTRKKRRPSKTPPKKPSISRLVRISVVLALFGLAFTGLFLWQGFQSWSVGLGVFIGLPLLLLAMFCYVLAVLRDLRQRDVL